MPGPNPWRPIATGALVATASLLITTCRAATADPPPASSPASQAASPSARTGPTLPPGFTLRTLDSGERNPRQYVVFAPRKYKSDRKWPVLIFLHGSGESGTNSIAHTTVGLGPYIGAHRLDDFPFITIFPQAPQSPRVLETFLGERGEWVWRMLADVQKEYGTDPDRVYLTGLSMGGFGTWDLAMEHPDRLAAIAPLCGGSVHPELIGNLASMPVWAFHGARDDRVPVDRTRVLIQALNSAGGNPKYTEYAELSHNCWDRAYSNPELYSWLLSHTRQGRPAQFDYTLPSEHLQMPWSIWWLRFDALESGPGVPRPRVACSVKPGGNVVVTSQGVREASLICSAMPVKPGDRLHIVWNGRTAFDGAAADDLVIKLEPPALPAPGGR